MSASPQSYKGWTGPAGSASKKVHAHTGDPVLDPGPLHVGLSGGCLRVLRPRQLVLPSMAGPWVTGRGCDACYEPAQKSHIHCHFSCTLLWSRRSPLIQHGRNLSRSVNAREGGLGEVLGAGCRRWGDITGKSRPPGPEGESSGRGQRIADGYQSRNVGTGVQVTGQLTHTEAWSMEPRRGHLSP